MVFPNDPPRSAPGHRLVVFDTNGRLICLAVSRRPAADHSSPDVVGPAAIPDLIRAAGLVPSGLTPVEPTVRPPCFADQRHEWVGAAANGGGAVRVVAASDNGTVVYFEVQSVGDGEGWWFLRSGPGLLVAAALQVTLIARAVYLASKNLLAGRVDRRYAAGVAGATFLVAAGAWLCRAHHSGHLLFETVTVASALHFGCVPAFIVIVFYLALEYEVRTTWPGLEASWGRVLTGRLRDSLVGTHALVGLAGAAVALVTTCGLRATVRHFGGTFVLPQTFQMFASFQGGGFPTLVSIALLTSLNVIPCVFLLTQCRRYFRRPWLVGVGFVAALTLWTYPQPHYTAAMIVSMIAIESVLLVVFLYSGMVGGLIGIFAYNLLASVPLVLDSGRWHQPLSAAALGLFVVLVVAATLLSLRGDGRDRAVRFTRVAESLPR
ncbi:MAG: hypothetical protein K2V38_17940, partial [Gemmataceae bacterium]|nr:hypothetical protein [Gemmataceae bacterium]